MLGTLDANSTTNTYTHLMGGQFLLHCKDKQIFKIFQNLKNIPCARSYGEACFLSQMLQCCTVWSSFAMKARLQLENCLPKEVTGWLRAKFQ